MMEGLIRDIILLWDLTEAVNVMNLRALCSEINAGLLLGSNFKKYVFGWPYDMILFLEGTKVLRAVIKIEI